MSLPKLKTDLPSSGSPVSLKTTNTTLSVSPIKKNAPTSSMALHNFKLLEALRSDDPRQVQPFLDELKPSPGSIAGQDDMGKAGSLLGMAVKVASVPIIHMVLNHPNIPSPNMPISPGSLTTALHVASETGRVDVVQLLLNDPRIIDTIRDDQGRTVLECASDPEVALVIDESRGTLQQTYLAKLAAYVSSPLNSVEESLAIADFLEGPRTEILNLSTLDEKSGTSLLHEAARRRDLRLVELAVRRGADVFVRDKRGRRVQENDRGADERIKVFLRQFSNQENLIQSKSDGRPPDLKGFLSKWVNYKSGWRTRWFILQDGVLSYYRNREDEAVACRGSIALKSAAIRPSTDGSRFEVHSRTSASVPKMIVKSAHRAEIARWVQAIKLNIEFFENNGGMSPIKPRRSLERQPTKQFSGSSGPDLSPEKSKSLAAVSGLPPTDQFLSSELNRTATSLSGLSAPSAANESGSSRAVSAAHMNININPMTDDEAQESLSVLEAAEQDSLVDIGGEHSVSPNHGIPHEGVFDLGVLNLKAQIESLQQLLDAIDVNPALRRSHSPEKDPVPMHRADSRQQAVKDALKSSLMTLSTLISSQTVMSQDRERYLVDRIRREIQARKVWEENMMTVAEQQAETDRQLTEAAKDNEKKRKALRKARGVLAGLSQDGQIPGSPSFEQALASPPPPENFTIPGGPSMVAPIPTTLGSTSSQPLHPQDRASISNISEVQEAVMAAGAESDEEDEDDEFFDAIETNQIPNLQLHDSIAFPDKDRVTTPQVDGKSISLVKPETAKKGSIKELLARQSLDPYVHIRAKLPIDDDKRPSVSLWGILKSSVGKDLTKITLPVSFNEPTSMLQRMAEDMEYDACLTVAATQEDSRKRIAFVGAFAMSNYSSTIGRVAKPFNPLLSQTYEYAVPNRYRYVSEQVSHHPPVSACFCEAPLWKYYGEVDTQNKFQGRSFEIRPTGVAHAELIIPKSWVNPKLDYPAAGPEYGDGYVVEHYSWRKVITNISNFIMGTPLIDHYGDLVVTNHRTGETCTLTFKPRTWRGKDAFEIKGDVTDTSGHHVWDIAGRWDSQLVARQTGHYPAPLESDAQFEASQKEYLLLWRKSEAPKAPFNLTPFAITLNDIPEGLEQYLCPTDCRLRTDQRAFENAEYEHAQELKTLNEEQQRNTRKLRAEGSISPHEPRWFVSTTDADTGDRVWRPKRAEDGEVDFWSRREKHDWANVDHIFVEAT